MIAYIQGKIVIAQEGILIIKVPSGVGYLCSVNPSKTYHVNDGVELFIYEVKREDKSELYAFETWEEREWLEKLTKVSGVGPKMAALIIFTLGISRIVRGIQETDTATFTEVKGLGAKTAKKLILELKGAITDVQKLEQQSHNTQTAVEFTETLSNLGYKRGEIVAAISKIKKANLWNDDDVVGMVKEGLKQLGKK